MQLEKHICFCPTLLHHLIPFSALKTCTASDWCTVPARGRRKPALPSRWKHPGLVLPAHAATHATLQHKQAIHVCALRPQSHTAPEPKTTQGPTSGGRLGCIRRRVAARAYAAARVPVVPMKVVVPVVPVLAIARHAQARHPCVHEPGASQQPISSAPGHTSAAAPHPYRAGRSRWRHAHALRRPTQSNRARSRAPYLA